MKKGFFRSGIIVLTMVLLLSMITGCGKTGEVSNQTNDTVSNTENSNTENGSTVETQPELKPVKLIWYTVLPEQKDQDLVFDQFNKKLKEKINAEVEIRGLDWGNYEEKLNIAIASHEPFDICWTSDWMAKYVPNVNKGAFMCIDELLPKYAPKTKELIADKFWDLTKVNGKLYGIPCYQIFYRQTAIWIKKDIAEKYNFDPSILTTDAACLTPFLEKIKEGEPDIIPLAANGPVIAWFGKSLAAYSSEYAENVANSEAHVVVFESDPTKVHGYDERVINDLMPGLRTAREWYTKGYVRNDLLSIKDIDQEIKTGKYAVGFSQYSPDMEVSFADKFGFEIVAYPLAQPTLSGVTATLMAISATSENPERAMMLIELLNTDKELYNLICNGIENMHYIKVGENRIKRVEDNGYQPNMNWAMGNTLLAYLTPGQPDNLAELVKSGNDAAIPPLLPGYTFDNSKVKNELAAIAQVSAEIENPLKAGVLDPDEYLPKMLERFKAAGLDKVVAEAQRQVDAYWAERNK